MKTNVWVERSKVSLNKKYKGVLFSSFPDLLNDYLHQWTSQLITEQIIKKDRYILDLGCGYGRVSIMIREKFASPLLIGLDISPYYAKEYVHHIEHSYSVISDSVYLPFRKGFFNIIFEVYSLTYLPDKERYQQALCEMFYSLNDDGAILIIENNRIGTYFLNAFGICSFLLKIIGRKESDQTKGLLFNYDEIGEMVQQNDGVVIKKTGMPVFTLFVHFSILLAFVSSKLLKKFLSLIRILDNRFQCLNCLSFCQFYLIRKKKGRNGLA